MHFLACWHSGWQESRLQHRWDGMGKARSGENELGRAEVPLIGTVTSNPAQSSLFTVAESEGRRKAAWQDAQSRSPSPPAALLSLMYLLAALAVPGAFERGRSNCLQPKAGVPEQGQGWGWLGVEGSPQPLSTGCVWGIEVLSFFPLPSSAGRDAGGETSQPLPAAMPQAPCFCL